MFREQLKILRKQRNITQEQLAAIVGVERSSVGKWEGKSGVIPSSEILDKLASFFDVSVDYLLGRTDVPKEPQTLDEQLKGVDFALYGETHDLTEEEKQDILEFVQYIKSKRKNKES